MANRPGRRTFGANGLDHIGYMVHNPEGRTDIAKDTRGYDVVIVAKERTTGQIHVMTTLGAPDSVDLLDYGMESIDGQRLPPN